MRPICVLLWKHWTVRKRRWFHTFVEFFFSILMIAMVNESNHGDNSEGEGEKRVVRLSGKRERAPQHIEYAPSRILYAPETDVTNQIMAAVGAKFDSPILNHFPEKSERGIFPVSEQQAKGFLTDMKHIDAVVIFNNKGDSWPDRLIYSIHMRKEFNSSTLHSLHTSLVSSYSASNDSGRRTGQESRALNDSTEDNRNSSIFLPALQGAIEEAYSSLREADGVDQTSNSDTFPLKDSIKPIKVMIAYEIATSCRIGLLVIFIFLMTSLLNDKNSGIQELIKMEGVSIQTIFLGHFLNALPGGLIYAISYPLFISAIFPNTSGFLLFLTLILHFLSIIPWAFIGAYLIDTRVLIFVISFFFYFAPMLVFKILNGEIAKRVGRTAFVLATALFPHDPMNWIFREIGVHEMFSEFT